MLLAIYHRIALTNFQTDTRLISNRSEYILLMSWLRAIEAFGDTFRFQMS